MIRAVLSVLILATGVAAPVVAQESLDVVDSLASSGRADEARIVLDSWWENARTQADRRDRQRGLWLRAILTVDPGMASLDFRRLVFQYPGGVHSDEALLRLGLIADAAEDLPRAAGYFRTLVSDYPRSSLRRRAREWLAEHVVAVEEAEAAVAALGAVEAETVPEATAGTAVVVPEAPAEVGAADRAEVDAPRYAVQVGAFESEERARNLLASVGASGFRARMVRVTGSDLVRIRIGSFFERPRAVELMDRVRRRGHEATIAVNVADEEPMQ
jgi:cell division septation protein DedD